MSGGLLDWLRGALRARDAGAPPTLGPLRDRLRLLASALAGERLDVREATDGIGGHEARALLLPPSLRALFGEAEASAFVYRVAFAVTSRRLGHRLPRDADPEARLLHTWLSAPATVRALDEELPGSVALRATLSSLERAARPPLPSLAPRASALEALARATLDERALPQSPEARRWAEDAIAASLSGAPAGDLAARLRRLPGRARDLPPPVMLWGVLGSAITDGNRAEDDAPSSRARRRPGERRVGVLPDDRDDERPLPSVGGAPPPGEPEMAPLESAGSDGGEQRGDFRYDEWDERRRAYRPDWCALSERRPVAVMSEADAADCVARVVAARRREIRALRSAFARVAQRRQWRGAQRDGADVDLDALVDCHALLRGGHAPPEKLYLDRRRERSDLATLVLIDASLSTFLPAGDRPILEVMRDAVLVLGEAVAGVHDQLAVAAFASRTRHDCRFLLLKEFDEPWRRARLRLPQLASDGATRIGPALRHATFRLARAPARRKLLLLLSDAKPMDLDGYEGRHGVADVRQALREARHEGVQVFALTVDQEAREHLPRMFGRHRYAILPDAGQLALRLARVHHDLLRG